MNISNWLQAAARTSPDAPALLTGARVDYTYGRFAKTVQAVAGYLKSRGIEPGDRVCLYMANCVEYPILKYAVWWLGAAVVPMNFRLHGKEALWIVDHTEAKFIFADTERRDGLAEVSSDHTPLDPKAVIEGALGDFGNTNLAPLPRSWDDLAWVFYTSGTTGRPKGAMLSHGNLIAMSLCYPLDVDPVHRQDAILYAAPMSHGAGLYGPVHVRMGARHVIPPSGGFDADQTLDLAAALRNVSFFAAPTIVKRLVQAAEKRGSNGDGIKTIIYGGAPMYRSDIEHALAVMGTRFVQIYGQGETPMTITALSREEHALQSGDTAAHKRLGSVGRAQSVISLRITGEDGTVQPTGAAGEIEVKGETVMLGYWKDPDATVAALQDGWLRTGDLGSLDEDGYLTLSDRSKDIIISGGNNIYPREIEEVLLTHPSVSEVCVAGTPHDDWGEMTVAFVVLKEGYAADEKGMDSLCLANLARYKRPKRYIFRASLPKNAYGKIVRRSLKIDEPQT